MLYRYDSGATRTYTFLGDVLTVIAVIGWVLLGVFVIAYFTGYFEELLIWLWEITR